jgi:ribosome biogenesis GTPase / thiamine phosphate phosphatase
MGIMDLGFEGKITTLIKPEEYEGFELARVIVEHKERYIVQSKDGVFDAEVTGNLRFTAKNRRDFPAVGDWVSITMMDSKNAIILKVLPRTSILERQAVGSFGEAQLIATNIDFAFIVQSVGQDYNLKRVERYLAICNSSGIKPVILLSKTDLVDNKQVDELVAEIEKRIKNVPVLPVSIEKNESLDRLSPILQPYKTYCFLGSSGAGKSTIVNYLKGEEILKTRTLSSSTNKGRHTTSHRELIILPNRSIVIDTPGMREIGMTDNEGGIELTYDEIVSLADSCRFSDCTHTNETGCAVLEAIEEGKISIDTYENYQKLKREQIHYSSTIVEKRKKSRAQGKLFRAIKNEIKKSKF